MTSRLIQMAELSSLPQARMQVKLQKPFLAGGSKEALSQNGSNSKLSPHFSSGATPFGQAPSPQETLAVPSLDYGK